MVIINILVVAVLIFVGYKLLTKKKSTNPLTGGSGSGNGSKGSGLESNPKDPRDWTPINGLGSGSGSGNGSGPTFTSTPDDFILPGSGSGSGIGSKGKPFINDVIGSGSGTGSNGIKHPATSDDYVIGSGSGIGSNGVKHPDLLPEDVDNIKPYPGDKTGPIKPFDGPLKGGPAQVQ